jgi:hypothetical protein
MLPTWFWFVEFFCAGLFFLLGATLRRCIPGIFIPGMFIPGMLAMSCFFPVCFFGAVLLFLLVVAFGLLIPGMLDISCCARTGKLATKRTIARTNDQTLICKRKFIALTFFIIPLKSIPLKEVFRWKDSFGRIKTIWLFYVKTSRRISVSGSETPRRELDQKNAIEDISGRTRARWCVLSG